MTTSMKLFVFLWVIIVGRVFGALVAGRQCLRLRHLTKYRQLYEWLTAFGVGLISWGMADLGSICNSIFNGPSNREMYPTKFLWFSIGFESIKSLSIWVITLVMINGGAPGFIRRGIFGFLTKIKVMDFANPEDDPRRVRHESGIHEQITIP